jgi:DNA primase
MSDYNDLVLYLSSLLVDYPGARDTFSYLKSRISPESILKYNFGYFPQLNEMNLLSNHLKFLIKSHLYFNTNNPEIKSSFLYFENYKLVMPYNDLYNNTLGLVGRTMLSEEDQEKYKISKYKNTKFPKSSNLFNLNFEHENIINNDYAIITEGQFDAIKASDMKVKCVIAAGTSNISQEQFFLLKRFTNNIYICLDNDNAGLMGTESFINKYSKYANLYYMKLPSGYKDIDEFLKSYDKKSFEELRQNSENT